MTDEGEHQTPRELVSKLVTDIDDPTRMVVLDWARNLMEIRNSNLSPVSKAGIALRVSTKKAVIVSTTKLIYGKVPSLVKELKRHGWDERGIAGRFTIGGIALGATAFSGKGAGVAALGSAIGVPLWCVLGAGGAFLGTLIEELSRKAPPTTEYTEIEARRIEHEDESTRE